jgi:heterodisulfide reductase subunit A
LDTLAPTGEAGAQVVQEMGRAVLEDAHIAIHTCSRVVHSEGFVGNFGLEIRREAPDPMEFAKPGTVEFLKTLAPGAYVPFSGLFPCAIPVKPETFRIEAGIIVLATGFESYVPRLGEYGFLQSPAVITLPELIHHMATQPDSGPTLTFNGRAIRRVAFIHCVGSRQIPGLHEPDADGNLNEYCSRTCCSAVLQAAARIRRAFPETRVLDYYRDIRTYGRGQEELYEEASAAGVLFFRFESDAPPLVEAAAGGRHPLRIRVKDTLTFGEELTAEVDLVVLAVGMVPRPINGLVEMMKLPLGGDRFLQEVHPKLRPVEVASTGILLAGTCQAPMDVGEACAAAQAAAVKGTSLLIKGYVELDPFVAEVQADRCHGHGVCAEVCPAEGAITLTAGADQGRKAKVNPALCTGCGICVPECPEKAIEVNGWTLRQYEEMVDAIAAA